MGRGIDMAKKFRYRLLNGMVIEGKNLREVIKLVGDRIFIPEHCDPKTYDFNEHYRRLLPFIFKSDGFEADKVAYEVKKGEKMGKKGFVRLQKKVAKEYVGKKVPKKYQKKYGKRYSMKEAMEIGKKVAGKIRWLKEKKKKRNKRGT